MWSRLSLSAAPRALPGADRRETFAFDRVLYKDGRISVTPSVLVVARGSGREYEYRIQDVGAVRLPPLAAERTLWRRRRTLHNLKFEVHSTHCVGPAVAVVQVHAENPGAAMHAIEQAKGIVY